MIVHVNKALSNAATIADISILAPSRTQDALGSFSNTALFNTAIYLSSLIIFTLIVSQAVDLCGTVSLSEKTENVSQTKDCYTSSIVQNSAYNFMTVEQVLRCVLANRNRLFHVKIYFKRNRFSKTQIHCQYTYASHRCFSPWVSTIKSLFCYMFDTGKNCLKPIPFTRYQDLISEDKLWHSVWSSDSSSHPLSWSVLPTLLL